jgi:prepilin-type N-terminal cleavage/methylation domain-containing protein
MNHRPRHLVNTRRAAFTLIELMISIALSLLLVAGINAIFRTTADTVSTGTAATNTARELRNAFDTMDADFSGFLDSASQPLLLIYNTNVTGFRDKVDEKSDTAYGTTPNEANALDESIAGAPALPTPTYNGMSLRANNRNHRVDILSFFSSGKFRRQTGLTQGSQTTYQGQYASETAYIWYGHVNLPSSVTADWTIPSRYLPPGMTQIGGVTQNAGSNPNGFYGNQFVLGRHAILTADPQAGAGGNYVFGNGQPQAYLVHPVLPPSPPPTSAQLMVPFAYNTPATFNGSVPVPPDKSGNPYLIQDSRVDVADVSASKYLDRVKEASVVGPSNNRSRVPSWYYPLLSAKAPSTTVDPGDTFRFACKPWLTRSNDQVEDTALNSPAFIKGCSQFIVEFAGDYAIQDPVAANKTYGRIIGQGSDGVLDFDAIPVPRSNPLRFQNRVRWYGLPRVYADNALRGVVNPAKPTAVDVLPVREFFADPSRSAIPLAQVRTLPFERIGYSAVAAADAFPRQRPAQVKSYVCAFNPYDLQFPLAGESTGVLITPVVKPGGTAAMSAAYPKGFMPWMIRLTIRVDDANGRLADGQTIEYIFNLPHK